MNVGTVYLLHFDRPYGPNGEQHYVGWTVDLERRLRQHCTGDPTSKTTQRAWSQGIGFTLARLWEPGTLTLERRIKRSGPRSACPFCRRRDRPVPRWPQFFPPLPLRHFPPVTR